MKKPVFNQIVTLVFLLAFSICCHAQSYTYLNVPISTSCFNSDVVAEGTPSTTTGTDLDGGAWVFTASGNSCGYTSGLWPSSITSTNGTGIVYSFQAATANNDMRLGGSASGTITLSNPMFASTVYLVSLQGSGTGTISVKFTYVDGSTSTTSGVSVPDWCSNGSNKLTTTQYNRAGRTNSCGGLCQYIYEIPVSCNSTCAISSITITNGTTGIFNFFALGAATPYWGADGGTPANPSGCTTTTVNMGPGSYNNTFAVSANTTYTFNWSNPGGTTNAYTQAVAVYAGGKQIGGSTSCGTSGSFTVNTGSNTTLQVSVNRVGTWPANNSGQGSAVLTYQATTPTVGTPSVNPVDFCASNGCFTAVTANSTSGGSVSWDWGSSNGTWNTGWVAGTTSGTCTFPKKTATSDATADRIRYNVTNGNCTVTSPTILIDNRYNEAPSTLASSSSTVCAGTGTITLTATFPANVDKFGTVKFYSGACGSGGTLITSVTAGDNTTTVSSGAFTAPTTTTTYYALYDPGITTGGCSATTCASTTVNVNPLPTITTTGAVASVCKNSSAITTTMPYTATTNSPTSYSISWTGLTAQGSTPFAFAAGGGTITGINVPANTTAGTYNGTMTITNANGCIATQAVSLVVVAAPSWGTISAPSNICLGGTVSFSAAVTGGTSNSITWTRAAASLGSGTTVTTGDAPSPAGTYYYRPVYTSTASGCALSTTTSQETAVTVATVPTWGTITPPAANICLGGSVTFSAAVSNGTANTITWTRATSSLAAGTTVTSADAPPAATTYYYRPVYTSSASGCSLATTTVQETAVTVVAAPTWGTITAPSANICLGGSVTFAAAMANAGYGGTITWTRATASLGAGTTVTSADAPPAATTYYYYPVYTSAASGCTLPTTTSQQTAVAVAAVPAWSTITAPSANICLGGSVTFSAAVTGGTGNTISWTRATSSLAAGTTVTSADAPPSATTYYYRPIYTSSASGCTLSTTTAQETAVTVVAAPTWGTITPPATNICLGGSVTFSAATAISGYGGTITWTRATASLGAGTTVTSADAPPSATTYYYRPIYTSAASGCTLPTTTSQETAVIVAVAPTWGTITAPSTTVCLGNTVSFSAAANNGYGGTITWTRATASLGAGTTVTSADAPPAATTYYYRPIYTSAASGCTLPTTTSQETAVVVSANSVSGTPSVTSIDFCSSTGTIPTAVTVSGAVGSVYWAQRASNGTWSPANPPTSASNWATGTSSGTATFAVQTSLSNAAYDTMGYVVKSGVCPATAITYVAVRNHYAPTPVLTINGSGTLPSGSTTLYNYCSASTPAATLTATFSSAPSNLGQLEWYAGSCGTGTLMGTTLLTGSTGTTYTFPIPSTPTNYYPAANATQTYYVRYNPNTASGGCSPACSGAVTVANNGTPALGTGTGQMTVDGSGVSNYSQVLSGCGAVTITASPDATSTPISPSTNNFCTLYQGGTTFGGTGCVQVGTPPFTSYTYTPGSYPYTGNFWVTSKNSSSGCVSTPVQIAVTVTQPFSVNMTSSSYNGYAIHCNGGSDGTVTATESGSSSSTFNYFWSNGNSVLSTGTSNTQSSLSAGTYTVTVVDANSCKSTASKTISAPAALSSTPTFTTYGSYAENCFGASVGTITPAISGGISPYTFGAWSASTGATTISSGTSAPTALKAGTYTFNVTDANSCAYSNSITLTQPSALALTYTLSYACNSGGYTGVYVTVIASGGASGTYLFNPGSGWVSGSGNSYTTSALGTNTAFTIQVEDAAFTSCTGSVSGNTGNYPSSGASASCNVTYVSPTGSGILGTLNCPASLASIYADFTAHPSTYTNAHLILQGGSYPAFTSAVTLPNNILIDGGYDGSWTKNNGYTATTINITAPIFVETTNNTPQSVGIYIGSNDTLQDLTIAVTTASSGNTTNYGTSVYGIYSNGKTGWQMNRCTVTTPAGGNGTAGVYGGGGAGGSATSNGGSGAGGYYPICNACCVACGGRCGADGNNGGAGQSGSAGSGGAGGAGGSGASNHGGAGCNNGYNVFGCNSGAGAGGNASAGNAGSNGTSAPATAPASSSVSAAVYYYPYKGASGGGGGAGQGGGQGGGAGLGTCCSGGCGSGDATGGTGGNGGAGGAGGGGGWGGGSAFAVYAYGGSGTLNDCSLNQGSAGSGGAGGGGVPGSGGNGGYAGGTYTGAGGSNGGSGGQGGSGGNGGNGQPGPNGLSQGYVNSNSASVTSSGSLSNNSTITATLTSCTYSEINLTSSAGSWTLPGSVNDILNLTPSSSSYTGAANQVVYTTAAGLYDLQANGSDYYGIIHTPILRTQPKITSITSPLTVCPGTNNVTLSCNISSAVTYEWYVFLSTNSVPSSATYTYSGSMPTTAPTISLTTAGTYYIKLRVKDQCCGWSTPDWATVIVTPAPGTASTPTGTTNVCPGQTYTYNVTSVTNPGGTLSYTWSYTGTGGVTLVSGSNTVTTTSGASITATVSGTTSVSITYPASLGTATGSGVLNVAAVSTCSGAGVASPNLAINIVGNPDLTIVGNTNICSGGTTSLTVNSAHTINTYSWSATTINSFTAVGTGQIINSSALTANNTYSVVITDNYGCSSTGSQLVTVATAPTWGAITAPAGNICLGGSVTFSAAANNGYGGAITWTRATSSLGAGTTVTSADAPPSATTYYYRPVYTSAASGCTLATTSAQETAVTVAAAPTWGTITAPASNVCLGGSVTFSATVGNGTGNSITWTRATSSLGAGTTVTSADAPPSATTYYYRPIYTSAANGCTLATTTAQETAVTVATAPTWGTITAPASNICLGASVTFSAPVNGGYGGSVTWTRATGSLGAGTTVTSADAPPSATTYYYRPVYTSAASGCTLATTTAQETAVTVATAPTWGTITAPTSNICLGASVTFAATANNGYGGSVTWTRANSSLGAGTTVTSADAPPSATTYYYRPVYTSAASGCTLATTTAQETAVTVAAAPTWGTITAPAGNICLGGSVTFSAPVNGGSGGSVTWTRATSSLGAGTTVTSVDAPPSATTYYYRPVYTSAVNGCTLATTTAQETAVTVATVPTWGTITAPSASICLGASVTFLAPVNNGYGGSVTWTRATSSLGAGTTVTSADAPPSATTYYYRPIYTSAANGCTLATTTAQETAVTVAAAPTWGTISAPSASICLGGSVTFSAPVNGGNSGNVTWTRSTTSLGTGTTVISPDAPSPAGTYYYRPVYNSSTGGCTLATTTAQETAVSVNAPPTITSSGTVVAVCYSNSDQTTSMPYTATTNLTTGSPTYSIRWSPGIQTQMITPATFSAMGGSITGILVPASTAPGTYTGTMTIATSGGCTITQSISLVVNPLPTITSTGTINAVCYSASSQYATLPYSATTNNPTSYSIVWNATALSANLTNQSNIATTFASGGGLGSITTIAIPGGVAAGTYIGTLSVANSNCSASSTIPISVTIISTPASPTVSVNGGSSYPTCQNATAPNIVFTNYNSTPVTVNYDIINSTGGTTSSSVNISGSGTATVSQSTTNAATYTYNITGIQYQTGLSCPVTVSNQSAAIIVAPQARFVTLTDDYATNYCGGGHTVTFNANGGTPPWSFYVNGTQYTTNSSTYVIAPVTNTTYTLSNPIDANSCTPASTPVGSITPPASVLSLASSSLAGTAATDNVSCTIVANGSQIFYDHSGNLIAQVKDLSGNGLGSTAVYVNVDAAPQSSGGVHKQSYLQRHINITPASGYRNNSAKVYLYLSQDEANALSTASANDWHTAPDYYSTFASNLSNICITKYSGTSLSNETPTSHVSTTVIPTSSITVKAPGTYGAINGTTYANTYEVSFTVTSWSGFYIHALNNNNFALPVTLLYLTADAINNKYIQLDWATASEMNNKGFDIERSTDGISFTSIGWVDGHGNSNAKITYQYEDMTAQPNVTYYYRLKQIDIDGHFEYSEIVSASLIGDKGFVFEQLVPNPATNSFEIGVLSSTGQKTTVVMTDMLGRIVINNPWQLSEGYNISTYDISGLAAGAYNVTLYTGDTYTTKRLVVTK